MEQSGNWVGFVFPVEGLCNWTVLWNLELKFLAEDGPVVGRMDIPAVHGVMGNEVVTGRRNDGEVVEDDSLRAHNQWILMDVFKLRPWQGCCLLSFAAVRRTPHGGSGIVHCLFVQVELLRCKKAVSSR